MVDETASWRNDIVPQIQEWKYNQAAGLLWNYFSHKNIKVGKYILTQINLKLRYEARS
jgi:hypothetical protein